MHELTLASALVDSALQEAAGCGARRITAVRARIGVLRMVDRTLLEEAFAVATSRTPAEGSRLVIDVMPIRLSCRACGWVGQRWEFEFECRQCGGLDVEWRGGDELELTSLDAEVDDEYSGSAADSVRDQLAGCR